MAFESPTNPPIYSQLRSGWVSKPEFKHRKPTRYREVVLTCLVAVRHVLLRSYKFLSPGAGVPSRDSRKGEVRKDPKRATK